MGLYVGRMFSIRWFIMVRISLYTSKSFISSWIDIEEGLY